MSKLSIGPANAATLYRNQYFAARDDTSGCIYVLMVTGDTFQDLRFEELTVDDKVILCNRVPVGVTKSKHFVYPLKFPQGKAHIEVELDNFLHLRGCSGDSKQEALKNLNQLYVESYSAALSNV